MSLDLIGAITPNKQAKWEGTPLESSSQTAHALRNFCFLVMIQKCTLEEACSGQKDEPIISLPFLLEWKYLISPAEYSEVPV
jgi:hypothetical protein